MSKRTLGLTLGSVITAGLLWVVFWYSVRTLDDTLEGLNA